MLTLRAAAALLAATDSIDALRTLVRPLGFAATPLPVDNALRAGLHWDGAVERAEIISGPGALRACLLELAPGAARSTTSMLATALASRAAHALWLCASVHPDGTIVLAVPRVGAPGATFVVDRGRIADSDADTIASLHAASRGSTADIALHARWCELLGRDALNRRFYRTLEHRVRAMATESTSRRGQEERDEVALACASRLLFLAFLQAKGWLDGDRAFIGRTFDQCMASSGGFHRRVLRPLFFGTLNTPLRRRSPVARAFGRIPFLNGGLFAPTAAERGPHAPVLHDAALGAMVHDVLGHYRFTAHEDRTSGDDAAVDPEMLGRAFESLMASRERRASGTFYTPSAFVGRVADDALLASVEAGLEASPGDVIDALRSGNVVPSARQRTTREALAALRVLDPACGSGAFLVHTLERLAAWYGQAGDMRGPDVIRRELLSRALFGVDRDATAVWLCELRLWLAVAVACDEPDPLRVPPLPNLDRNIRVGDALAGTVDWAGREPAVAPRMVHVAELRSRYARATGARKRNAARTLDAAERRAALESLEAVLARLRARRTDVVAARRGRDLFGNRSRLATLDREALVLRMESAAVRREHRRLRRGGALPFHVTVHFADIAALRGFTTVLGNPPWVRPHRIPPAERDALRERFTVLRDACWTPGAAAAGAGSGFGGQADLAALFVERSLALLRPGGILALLLPAKLWTALAGGGVRRLLADAVVRSVEDCTEAPELFDAVTYPSILVASTRHEGAPGALSAPAQVTVHRRQGLVRWTGTRGGLEWDDSPGSPWLLLPPPARAAFDRMRAAGRRLGELQLGRPLMGVKCGCNDAFLVHAGARDEGNTSATLRDVVGPAGRRGRIESELLRPVLRGEGLRAWCNGGAVDDGDPCGAPGDGDGAGAESIIWTHGETGPLRQLPPQAAAWLRAHRPRLAARSDVRTGAAWWGLHRTEGASPARARTVWPDMVRTPRATWLQQGDPTVPLNTCYVLPCATEDDACAFAALLNTPLVAAWLRALAEPARGGYRRLLAWTIALMPLPRDWPRARDILAPLARDARRAAEQGTPPAGSDLLEAALDAYRLRHQDIAPLLEWQFE